MRHLLAVGPARWAPSLAPGVPAPLAPPQPAPPGCLWRRDIETRGTAARWPYPGPRNPAGKILQIHRELPGRIHIVAIRQPPGF
jgi:hypothetical protein